MAARRPSRRSTPSPSSRPPAAHGAPAGARLPLALCAGALVVLGALAYWGTLSAPFVLDDQLAIVENPDIRQLWSLAGVRSVLGESPLLGRPLVTWSFAINYAIGGLNVRGYHLGNIAVHIACALVLFGLVRRVTRSMPLAFACASLWMLHPLTTESVDYVTQRTESMMGLFYLLTVYASVRAHGSARPARWLAVAVTTSALGMAAKQSMATVPLAVVLVDRVFFFDTLRAAVRRRWGFYTALVATWVVLAILVAAGPNVHSIGFGDGVTWWTYLLNQGVMITQYLKLTVWPWGLVADYGYPRPLTLVQAAPYVLFVGALFVATIAAFRRWPALACLGAWFFLTLAPTSSVVPVATEVGAERRMYVPLMGLVVLAVVAASWLVDRIKSSCFGTAQQRLATASVLWVAAASTLTAGTIARNRDYSTPLRLAQTSLDRWPTGRARHLVATALLSAGRRDEAIGYLRDAVRDDPGAHLTLGVTLFQMGQLTEARGELQEFIRLEPLRDQAVDARAIIGRTLLQQGQLEAAAEEFAAAAAMRPSFPDAHLALGEIRFRQQRFAEAIGEYRRYLASDAGNAGVWLNMAVALQRIGRKDDAIEAFRRSADLNPSGPDAHRDLAAELLGRGALAEAAVHAQRAVELQPQDPLSHDLLGLILAAQSHGQDAVSEFQRSLQLNPGDTDVQAHLAQALAMSRARAGGSR